MRFTKPAWVAHKGPCAYHTPKQYAQRLLRLLQSRPEQTAVDVFVSRPPRLLANCNRRPRRESAYMEYEADPEPRFRALWTSAEAALHAVNAYRPRVDRQVGTFGEVACEWERRCYHYDLGSRPVSICFALGTRDLRCLCSDCRNARGKVWGSDEVNVEGWKPLKRLPGHESGAFTSGLRA